MEECPTNRRPHQSTRNPYRPRKKKGTDDNDDSGTDELIEVDIDKWDAWFYEDSSDDVSDTEKIDLA